MSKLQTKLETCYKNLNDANKRILTRALEIIVECKTKLEKDPTNEELQESLDSCYRIVKMIDIENNRSVMEEIIYDISKTSGIILKGILIGLISM